MEIGTSSNKLQQPAVRVCFRRNPNSRTAKPIPGCKIRRTYPKLTEAEVVKTSSNQSILATYTLAPTKQNLLSIWVFLARTNFPKERATSHRLPSWNTWTPLPSGRDLPPGSGFGGYSNFIPISETVRNCSGSTVKIIVKLGAPPNGTYREVAK